MSSESLIGVAWTQAWQIAVAALLVALASRWSSRSRPHLGLLLWTMVFVKCVIPPVWTSPIGVFSWAQLQVKSPALHVVETRSSPGLEGGLDRRNPDTTKLAGSRVLETASPSSRLAFHVWLLGLWAMGAVTVASIVSVRWVRGQRWIARVRAPGDPELERRTAQLARRLGVRRPVELIICNAIVGPAASGVFHPRLILPSSLVRGRRFDELESILAHELIHIRRHDVWLLLFEQVAKAIWWFHPLVWYAARQTGRYREQCCDAETVASLGCAPAVYARSLLDVLEHLQVVRRDLSLAPGLTSAEVTLKRLETIMRESHTFRKRTPRYVWFLIALTAGIILPGSPLVLRSKADPADPPEVAAKIDQLENAGRQAGLTDEELRALIETAKQANADKRKLVQALCADDATAAQKQAFEKIVRTFGHPLEDDLWKLRDLARQAGLNAEETAAAEKLALATGFNDEAILLRYETGKMSEIEKSAFQKVLAKQGHPKAEDIEKLNAAGKKAGLNEAQIQTLRGLVARAGWDLDRVIELKVTGKLTADESTALAKLEADIGPLELAGDGESKDKQAILQLIKAAGCTPEETSALLAVLRKGEIEDPAIIPAMRSGKYTEAAATGLGKLESLLGKLDEFITSPHKDTVGDLLKTAAAAGLDSDETGVMLQLALRADYDLENVKQLMNSGQLSNAESQVLEKIRTHLGR